MLELIQIWHPIPTQVQHLGHQGPHRLHIRLELDHLPMAILRLLLLVGDFVFSAVN